MGYLTLCCQSAATLVIILFQTARKESCIFAFVFMMNDIRYPINLRIQQTKTHTASPEEARWWISGNTDAKHPEYRPSSTRRRYLRVSFIMFRCPDLGGVRPTLSHREQLAFPLRKVTAPSASHPFWTTLHQGACCSPKPHDFSLWGTASASHSAASMIWMPSCCQAGCQIRAISSLG